MKKNYLRIKRNGRSSYKLCSIEVPAHKGEAVIRNADLKCLQQTYQNIEVLIITHNSSDGMRKKAKANDVWLRSFDLGTKQSAKAIDLSYCIEQSSKGAAFGNICCSNSFKGQNI